MDVDVLLIFRTQCLQPVPYFKRIAQRRKLNPFAIGLKSRSSDNDSSIFYREILLRGFVSFEHSLFLTVSALNKLMNYRSGR